MGAVEDLNRKIVDVESRLLNVLNYVRMMGAWVISPTDLANADQTVVLRGAGNIAFGDPPPTAADEGTGIFIDATGMYGLEADTQNFYVRAADGKAVFGAGNVVLDASGINISGNTSLNMIQGTLTAAAPGWNHTATWNNAAVVFSGLKSNITNTASDDTSALLDLQVGGTSNFKVLKGGAVVSLGSLSGTTAILSALTAGRVALVTTAGTLVDDADLTFSGSTLTATNVVVSTALTLHGGVSSAWAPYTPTWAGLSIGDATVSARWCQIGKVVFVSLSVTFGASTTFSGGFTATMPVTAHASAVMQGQATLVDIGTVTFNTAGAVYLASTTTMAWRISGVGTAAANVSNTVPWTWATGDIIVCSFSYEAA